MVLFSPVARLPYREPLDDPALDVATQDLTDTIDRMVIPSFATTFDRDNAYVDTIAEGGRGMTCYIVERDSLCVYRINGWRWISTPRIAYSYQFSGFQIGANVSSSVTIANSGTIPMAPGQRLLCINAAGDLQGSTGIAGTGWVGLNVGGPGVFGNMRTYIGTMGPDGQQVLSRQWWVKTTGDVSYSMVLQHGPGTGYIDVYNPWLQVIDYGATD